MMAWSWNRFMEPASAKCVSLRSRDPMPTGSLFPAAPQGPGVVAAGLEALPQPAVH